jgi:pimeloyl-ACP methyl ester carboxylesterase
VFVEQFPLDVVSLVCLTAQYQHDQYERAMHHVCLHGGDYDVPGIVTIKAGRVKLPFRHLNLSTGGGRLPFGAKRYGWFVRSYAGTGDGTLRVAYDVLGAELEGVFDFDYRTAFPNDPAGIYRGRILPIDAAGNPVASSECYPPFRFWIDPDGTAKNIPLEIAQTGSFEWSHEADPYSLNLPPTYHAVVRPKRPMLAHPLPANVTPFPPLPSGTPKAQLSRINLGPAMDQGNRWYPCITDRGIQVTENTQGYYFSQGPNDFLSPFPILPLVDGPRNVATYGYTTDVWQGRDRKFYHATPYSRRVVDSRGQVRTLFGLYSQYPAYWEDLAAAATKGVLHPSLAIRGQWPNTTRPRAQQFPLRSWFEFFLPSTVVQGTGTPVQDATMVVAESPHPEAVNPTSVVGDDHGWILEVVYDGTDHTKEPTVYERFAVDRPFGGKLHTDGLLYVAERGKHRVLAIDPTTWQLMRVVLDGGAAAAALGSINAADDTFRLLPGKTPADARAAKCVDPTGLDIAGDWLYVGSRPMGGVFRVNLRDGTWQWARDVSVTDIQSHFVNVRVMADHTLFTCTFDNQYLGRPRAAVLSPDATQTHSQAWDWTYFGYDQVQGVGSTGTLVDIYPMSMSVTKDAIAVGGSQESLAVFVKRDPSEVIPPAAVMKAGHHEYNGAALYLLYGRMGMGPEVPPAGLTPNSDAWLTANGVVPGAQPAPPPVQPPPVTPPPVTPPPVTPPGALMSFKSVALRVTTTDGSDLAPTVKPTDPLSPQPATGQRWEIEFHGSGGSGPGTLGPYYVNGDKWRAICDQAGGFTHLAGVDVPFLFNVMNSGGRPGVSAAAPIVRFQPIDALPLQTSVAGRNPAWTSIETYHHGYTYGSTPDFNSGGKATGGTYEPFTERKYLAMLADAKTRYPQADWSKKGITFGNSMGAWACFNFSLRHPELIGGFFACNPRVRHQVSPDYNFGFGALNPTAKTVSGQTFAQDRDHVAYVANPANKTPFMCWTIAVNDGFSPFQDHIDMITACRQIKRPFAVIIHDGIHDSVATTLMNARLRTTYTPDLFYGGGIPAFSNSSRDFNLIDAIGWTDLDMSIPTQPKGKGRTGGINEGFKWRNVVESAAKFECEIANALGDTTVDVVPYSDVFTTQTAPQHVTIPAGQWVKVTFDASVVVPPPVVIPPASIDSFTASKLAITRGDTVTLSWATRDTVFVLLSDRPNLQLPPNGSADVTPQIDTTYTLLADDRAANVSAAATLTITVAEPATDPQLAARVSKLEAFLTATFKAF